MKKYIIVMVLIILVGFQFAGKNLKSQPDFISQNLILDTFDTEERVQNMRALLGEESWTFLSQVMEHGHSNETELTYSGFISELDQGIDLLMTEDNKIYCLSYGEGPTNIFYTNDEQYKNLVPKFMLEKVKAFDDMKFVYKSDHEEIIKDEYVWVRGHYQEPLSWSDSDTLKWDHQEASEYLEIIVHGAIRNISLVTFEEGPTKELVLSEVIHKIDDLEDQTLVAKVNMPEGIPYQAIRFENNSGERFYYIIQENSLSGEANALNEYIYPIKTGESFVINSHEGLLNIPKLLSDQSSLDKIIPSGWEVIDFVEPDYNKDGHKDYIGVLQLKYLNSFKFEEEGYPRILIALKGLGNGQYNFDFQDINLVRNYSEGGVFGDPYLPLTTDGSYFEINSYGGSGWRWSERFRYEYIDDVWYLTQSETSYGYGIFITHYSTNDYLKGHGQDRYNNDTFENIENRGEEWEPFDLSIEKKLDPMKTLKEHSELAYQHYDRINLHKVKGLDFNDDIDAVHHDEILASLFEKRKIKTLNENYILLSTVVELEAEYYILYDRKKETGQVIFKSNALDGFPREYVYFRIYNNKLYFSRNDIKTVEYTDSKGDVHTEDVITSMGLYSSDIDGQNINELSVHNNRLDEQGRYPYTSLYFDIQEDVIYYNIYRSEGDIFYKIGVNGEDGELLGEL